MIEDWVSELWQETAGVTALLQQAYGSLASMSLIPDQVSAALEAVYPTLEDPEAGADPQLVAKIEKDRILAQAHQTAVLDLFEGSATRTPATIGTAWGLYNSLVEYEDFGRSRSSKRSVVFGAGAERKQQLFAHLYALTR